MFRFAHPELLYLLIVIPLLIVFYVVMIRRKKKAIAEFGNAGITRAFDASFIVQAGHVEVRYADAGLIVCHCRSGRPSVRFETAAGEEKRCRVDDRSRRFQFDDGPGYQTQSVGKS